MMFNKRLAAVLAVVLLLWGTLPATAVTRPVPSQSADERPAAIGWLTGAWDHLLSLWGGEAPPAPAFEAREGAGLDPDGLVSLEPPPAVTESGPGLDPNG